MSAARRDPGAGAAQQQAPGAARRAAWARDGERSNAFMLRLMTWISLRLGRRPARLVLLGISAYFLACAPKARRASRDYLRRALGRQPTWRERFSHVHAFASTVHDRVFLLNDRADLFDIRIRDREPIEAVLAGGRGALLLGAHFGSFEVLRVAGRLRGGLRMSLLMYPDNARKINAALHAINPDAQQDIIALGRPDSMLRLGQALDAGGVVGMLADRSLHEHAPGRRRFLGADASWPLGPLRIAALLRRPVLFMAGVYLGDNRYELVFEPLADFSDLGRDERAAALDAALTRYVALLEQHCLAAPCNWFNFYDFWADAGGAGAAGAAGAATRSS